MVQPLYPRFWGSGDSKIISWQVTDSNGNLLNKENYDVIIKSKGFTLVDNNHGDSKNAIDYLDAVSSQLFRYIIGRNNNFDGEILFKPADVSRRVDYTEGKLKLKYSPKLFGNKNWYQLLAGTYEDTITITVVSEEN